MRNETVSPVLKTVTDPLGIGPLAEDRITVNDHFLIITLIIAPPTRPPGFRKSTSSIDQQVCYFIYLIFINIRNYYFINVCAF